MFFSKKKYTVDNPNVCYDVKKIKKEEKRKRKEEKNKSSENNNENEKTKIKLSKKAKIRICLVMIVSIIILGIIGHIEIQKGEREELFSKSLTSFIYGKYDEANSKLKDIKPKTDDEKSYIELISISKNISSKTRYFNDEEIILEYIDILKQMKELVNKSDGITIKIYKNKKHKEITITEVPFNDAIRYAEDKILEIEENETNILNKKNPITAKIIDSKMIGYFVNIVDIKGNGDSYYKDE
ncbi:MAG: hypothetical protein HFJ43_01545 [Clostridia bacterium]|nr:hypothetical protein [Clostridia bacterium]